MAAQQFLKTSYLEAGPGEKSSARPLSRVSRQSLVSGVLLDCNKRLAVCLFSSYAFLKVAKQDCVCPSKLRSRDDQNCCFLSCTSLGLKQVLKSVCLSVYHSSSYAFVLLYHLGVKVVEYL